MNPYYQACPTVVQQTMDKFAELTGRHYHLFDYVGAPDAEHVIVLMGSGVETVAYLQADNEKVGVLKVRLFRPFSVEHFLRALPSTVRMLAVLDRTKEPGSADEPLYLDVVAALAEDRSHRLQTSVIGGCYGLSSKEFTSAICFAGVAPSSAYIRAST